MIKIITDSAADIPKEEAAKYNITVLAVPITIDGHTLMEGEDISTLEFYRLLQKAAALPTTAQVTPMRYLDSFIAAARQGYTAIVCVTITAKGSGMFDAARIARGMFLEDHPEFAEKVDIEVVDSESYTYVYGHAVVDMARAAAEGKPLADVLTVFHRRRQSYQAYFGLTNLDYAKKSGRITSAAAFAGELLGFRPLMTIHNGETDNLGKVRGDQKLMAALVDIYKQRRAGDGRGFYIMYADNLPMGQQLRKIIEKETKDKCMGEYYIGAAVTINAGPTAFGVIVPVDEIK